MVSSFSPMGGSGLHSGDLAQGLIHLVEHVGHGDGQGILPPHHGGAGVDLEDDLIRPVQVFQGHDQVTA